MPADRPHARRRHRARARPRRSAATCPPPGTALLAGQSGVRALDRATGPTSCRSRSRRRSRSSPPRCWSGSRPAGSTARRSSRWSRPWRPGPTPARPETSTASGSASSIASGIGGVDDPARPTTTCCSEKGPRRVSPLTVPMLMPNGPAASVGLESARGPACTPRSRPARRAPRRSRYAHRPDPPRPRRRRRRRRHRGRASTRCRWPAFANMMALSKRNDEPERGLAPVRQGPRRLRARRGRRRPRPRVRGARRRPAARRIYAEVAGAGITADAHDIAQPDPDGPGRRAGDRSARCEDAGLDRRRHRAHQRPRHLDPAGRHRRGLMRSARRSATHADQVAVSAHQVDDRPPARRRRRARVDRHGAGAAPPARAADDQPRRPRRRGRPRHRRGEPRDAARPATSPRSTTPSASAAHNVAVAFRSV